MPLDVTDATFQTDVIDRSHDVAVVVDLWAPWCGPCRTLGPILEKVVAETGGKVEMVKVNVDENPAISQAFRVQSIPLVVAIKNGEAVNGFMGAQPEQAVREFVGQLLPSAAETELADLVDAGDASSLLQALQIDPGHEPAIMKLAELMIADGHGEQALELLARIPESAETRRIAAMARVGAEPTDDYDVELTGLLPRVKNDDEARQRFVDILELMGPEDARTSGYRRKLTAALF